MYEKKKISNICATSDFEILWDWLSLFCSEWRRRLMHTLSSLKRGSVCSIYYSPWSVVSQCYVSMKFFNDHSCSHSRSKRTGGKCMTITAILLLLSGSTAAEIDSAPMVAYIWTYKRIIGILFTLGTSKKRHLNSFTWSNKIFIEVQTRNTVIEVWTQNTVIEVWTRNTVIDVWTRNTVIEVWTRNKVIVVWTRNTVIEFWTRNTVINVLKIGILRGLDSINFIETSTLKIVIEDRTRKLLNWT